MEFSKSDGYLLLSNQLLSALKPFKEVVLLKFLLSFSVFFSLFYSSIKIGDMLCENYLSRK